MAPIQRERHIPRRGPREAHLVAPTRGRCSANRAEHAGAVVGRVVRIDRTDVTLVGLKPALVARVIILSSVVQRK